MLLPKSDIMEQILHCYPQSEVFLLPFQVLIPVMSSHVIFYSILWWKNESFSFLSALKNDLKMIDLLRCLKECQPFLTIRERVKCSHTNRLCADHEHIFEPTALLHCKPPLIPQNNTSHWQLFIQRASLPVRGLIGSWQAMFSPTSSVPSQ